MLHMHFIKWKDANSFFFLKNIMLLYTIMVWNNTTKTEPKKVYLTVLFRSIIFLHYVQKFETPFPVLNSFHNVDWAGELK